MSIKRTIKVADIEVPIIERDWTPAPKQGYRRTYDLKPGQRWGDALLTEEQSEGYVTINDETMPVGAAIARELVGDGASCAVFTELWKGIVLVGHDLQCVSHDGPIGDLLNALRAATGRPGLGGLPDVLALFPDGHVAMREAKKVSAYDSLKPNQKSFLLAAHKLLGDRLDFAIIEWDIPASKRKGF